MAGLRRLTSLKQQRRQQSQIDDLAFTINGAAAEIPNGIFDEDSEDSIKIIAHTPNSKPYSGRLSSSAGGQHQVSPPSCRREDLEPLVEGAEPPVNSTSYLVVGFVYPGLEASFKILATPKQMPVGISRPDDEERIISFDPNAASPLVAVVRILSGEQLKQASGPGVMKSFVLLRDEHNAFCTPYTVSQSEVFYLSRYRDNTTAKISRGPNWNSKVKEVMSQIVQSGADVLTASQRKLRKARDTTRVILDTRHHLVNEMLTLAAGLEHSSDKWFVEQLGTLLGAVEADLAYRPLPENINIYEFIEGLKPLTQDQAHGALQEVLVQWPEMNRGQVTADAIAKLDAAYKHAIEAGSESDFIIDYRLVRNFIAEGARRLSTVGGSAEYSRDQVAFIKDVYASAQCTTPLPESKPLISGDATNSLLIGIRNLVERLVKSSDEFDAGLLGMTGHAAIGKIPTQIWSEHAFGADIDSVKAAFMSVAHFFSQELLHKEHSLATDLKDLLQLLDNLKLT